MFWMVLSKNPAKIPGYFDIFDMFDMFDMFDCVNMANLWVGSIFGL